MTVINFPGGRSDGSNFETFVEKITEQDRVEAVRERLKQSGARPRAMDRAFGKIRFGRLRDSAEVHRTTGFLYPQIVKAKDCSVIVVSSPEFPRIVSKITGIPDVQAQELAANDVLTYGFVVAGVLEVKSRSLRGSPTSGLDTSVWPEAYHQGPISVPYRVGAHIALGMSTYDQDTFYALSSGGTLPPHLAALQNPASRELANTAIATYLG